jgi:DNA-binding YbaB/EbfC family protein
MKETPMAEPNISQLLKAAKEMQENMQKAHKELSEMEVIGKAGTDEIGTNVVMNGRYQVKKVTITDAAMQEGKAFVEDLVGAAFNAAVQLVERTSQEKLAKITKGMGMPQDFNLPTDPDK